MTQSTEIAHVTQPTPHLLFNNASFSFTPSHSPFCSFCYLHNVRLGAPAAGRVIQNTACIPLLSSSEKELVCSQIKIQTFHQSELLLRSGIVGIQTLYARNDGFPHFVRLSRAVCPCIHFFSQFNRHNF